MARSRKVAKRLVPEDVAMLVAHVHDQLESERGRMARRLHGDVAGMLAAARMDLSRLAGRLDDPDLREQVGRVDQILEAVIQNARMEMQRLHPALLDHFGLAAALRHLVEESCRAAGAEYTLDLPDSADGAAKPVELAAYRVVETLLAERTLRRVAVRLRDAEGGVGLTVQVEGGGSHSAAARRNLTSLRAWIESMGAAWRESTRGEIEAVNLDFERVAVEVAPAPTPVS